MTDPSPAATSDPGCLFCRIVAGDLPARRVYADDDAVAFLDVSAWHRGHTLVVPRVHVADLVSGPPSLAAIAPAVDTVARLLRDRLGADGINLISSSGEVAGQTVFHLHVHVVPRYAAAPGFDRLVNPGPVEDSELDAVLHQLTAGA